MIQEADEDDDQQDGDQSDKEPMGCGKASANDRQFAEEQREGRRARDCDRSRQPQTAENGIVLADQANARNSLCAIGAHDAAGAEEHRRLVQRMVKHVIERAGDAERTAEPEAERDHAHMLDAGIGHQPLHSGLADDEESGDEKRESAEREERAARQS